MDLRTGESYWRAVCPLACKFPSLEDDVQCEAAVIGGGITGALISNHLVSAGVDTILIDKGELAAASTAASTGLLQYEIDTPLIELIAHVGEAAAVQAYRRGLSAIDEMEILVNELSDRCGFSRRSSIYLASARADLPELYREFECRRDFHFDVSFWTESELAERSSIRAPGAIYSRGDGQIDPYRLTRRLLDKACLQGLRVFARTEVRRIEEKSETVTLWTADRRITARWAVFATGYESKCYLPQDVGRLQSTYVAISEPISSFEGWPDGCLIWETARPYFYARQTPDGRAIIGGEDTDFREDHNISGMVTSQTGRLTRRFAELFPNLQFAPAYLWGGTFGDTKDGLPYIGRPAGRDRLFAALGYGGNGITFSVIAARLITDLMLQRPNPDAALFRFGR